MKIFSLSLIVFFNFSFALNLSNKNDHFSPRKSSFNAYLNTGIESEKDRWDNYELENLINVDRLTLKFPWFKKYADDWQSFDSFNAYVNGDLIKKALIDQYLLQVVTAWKKFQEYITNTYQDKDLKFTYLWIDYQYLASKSIVFDAKYFNQNIVWEKFFDFNVRLGFSPQTYFERDIKACFLNDEINGIYYVNENDKNAKNNEIDQKVKAKIKEFKKDMNCIKKHLFVFVNSLNQPKLSNNKEASELVWFLCQVVTANRKNLVDEAIAKDESDEDFSDRMAIRRYFHAFHEWIEDGYNTKFITKKNSPFLMKNHFRDFLYYIHHNHKKYIPKEASYQAIDFKKAIDDFLPLAKNNHKIIALEKAVGSYIMANVLEKNVISFTWEDHFAKYGQDYMKWMAIVVSTAALVYTAGVIFDIKVATIIDTLKKIPRLSANFLNDIGGNFSGSGIWGKEVNLTDMLSDFIFGATIVKIIDDKIIISDINSIINKKKVEITNDKITIISKKNLERINNNIEINNGGDNIVNENNQENININNEEEKININNEEEEDINDRQKITAPIKKTIEENIKKIFRGRPLVILGRGERINNNNIVWNNVVWCDFDALPEVIKKKINVNKGVINRLPKDHVFRIIMLILKENIVNNKKITTRNIAIRDDELLKIIDDCFKNNGLETTLEYFNNNTIKKEELLEMMEKDDLIDKNKCKQYYSNIYSRIRDTIRTEIGEFLHFKFDSDTNELMIARNSLSDKFDYILSSPKFEDWRNKKFLPFSILQDAIMMISLDLFNLTYSFNKLHKIVADYLNPLFLKCLNNKNTIEKKELLEMMKKDDLIDKNKYKQHYYDDDIEKICDKINNIISSELEDVHFKFDSDTNELMIARNSLSGKLDSILSLNFEKWKDKKFLPFSILQKIITIMILDYTPISFLKKLHDDYDYYKMKKIVVDYSNSLFSKCLNNNEK